MTVQPDAAFIALQEALAGEYSLERELGRGGMGIVYLAREVSLDRLVAIKVLPPEFAVQPELRERFVREARTAARLSHPNIVPIHRVGEAGAFVYFAMAFVDGVTLGQRVREHGPLPPHEASRILREGAWGLAYAHARGIVHRDVKPDNILLESGSGRALLTDFGIAHMAHAPGLTESGQVLGTAQYMSPEQAAGEPLDGRSDLYSLAIVAHFALTGRVPFDAPNVSAILAKQLTQPAPPLASVAPTVPRKLAEAIDRCLAKDANQRFPTGEALAEALGTAGEVSHEIPAPVRVWIQRGERGRPIQAVLSIYATVPTLGSVLSGNLTAALMMLPFSAAALGALIFLPPIVRTRRLLSAGYGLDDIRAGLREHIARRDEELRYERSQVSTSAQRIAAAVSAVSWASFAAAAFLVPVSSAQEVAFAFTATVGTVSGVVAVVGYLRDRFHRRVSRWTLRMWNGGWGQRMVRVARFRLKRSATAPALPQATEVAIGRATDLLFDALPAATRKELRDLPSTVRKLEDEGRSLRAQIDAIERQIALLEADDRAASSHVISALATHDDSLIVRKQEIRAELDAAHDHARRQLAATVTALENIRLGLLRLQIGSIGAESITALVDAARATADEVQRRATAQDEVEQSLASSKTSLAGM